MIDLVMLRCGWDLKSAARWLAGLAPNDLAMFAWSEEVQRPARNANGAGEAQECYADPEIYAWIAMKSPLGKAGRTYLASRGISKKTYDTFRVGELNNVSEIISEAIGTWGFKRVQACGLLSRGATERHPRPVLMDGYLLFPFFREGVCEYLQLRRIGESSDGPRWKCLTGLPPPLYHVDCLTKPRSKELLICEGITDVLSAVELGRDAIGLLGANASLPEEWIQALSRRYVHVLSDNDPAGRIMASRIVRQLERRGGVVVVQSLPDGCNDLNEYLMRTKRRSRM